MNPDVEFFLYSKEECRLCDRFLNDLRSLLGYEGYTCHVIKIDSDPELMQRYGARIPVLVAGGVELCEQILNEEVVLNYFYGL